MEQFLRVGVITSTHGLRGEVKVFPTTDDAKRFEYLKKVWLDTGKEQMPLEIRGVKFFKQFVIVKFKGIDHINEIEKYKGCPLLVERDQAVELKEDEYFIADLIGMEVFADGARLGTLKEVMETGANEVYIVDTDAYGEVLIPAIKQCVLNIDVERRRMEVHLLQGLLQGGIE